MRARGVATSVAMAVRLAATHAPARGEKASPPPCFAPRGFRAAAVLLLLAVAAAPAWGGEAADALRAKHPYMVDWCFERLAPRIDDGAPWESLSAFLIGDPWSVAGEDPTWCSSAGDALAFFLETAVPEARRAGEFRRFAEEVPPGLKAPFVRAAYRVVPREDLVPLLRDWQRSALARLRALPLAAAAEEKAPADLRAALDLPRVASTDIDPAVRAAAVSALGRERGEADPAFLLGRLDGEREAEPLLAVLRILVRECNPGDGPPPPLLARSGPRLAARLKTPPGLPAAAEGEALYLLRCALGGLLPYDVLAGAPPDIAERALNALPSRDPGESDSAWHGRLAAALDDLAARGPYRPEDEAGFLEALRRHRGPFREQVVHALHGLPFLGGEEGLAAVDAFLPTSRGRRPFRTPGCYSPELLIARGADEQGRPWGLDMSFLLPGRLALVPGPPPGSDEWGREIVIGHEDGFPGKVTGLAVRGDEVRIALASGGERVLSLAALLADFDRDGITDIVERDLGLCPYLADSDSDGEMDGLDPFPLLRPGPLSEDDRVREAVLRRLARQWVITEEFVLLLAGEAPAAQVEAGPLMHLLTAVSPREEWGHRWPTTVGLTVHRDGDRARVASSQTSGGLSGIGHTWFLRRINGRWWVTACRWDWIS